MDYYDLGFNIRIMNFVANCFCCKSCALLTYLLAYTSRNVCIQGDTHRQIVRVRVVLSVCEHYCNEWPNISRYAVHVTAVEKTHTTFDGEKEQFV